MKILAVSDRVLEHLHSPHVKERYGDIGLLIGCGDLPYYYLEFLISALDVPLVYVRGNHDDGPQYTSEGRVLHEVPGGQDIHGRGVKHQDLLLAGLEGSMRYRKERPFMYTESEMRREVTRLLPFLLMNRLRYGRFLDILVTHSPPFSIHDRSDIPHTGFKIFLQFMRLFKPRFLLHGHIHLYGQQELRSTWFERTLVVNVYPYFVLETL